MVVTRRAEYGKSSNEGGSSGNRNDTRDTASLAEIRLRWSRLLQSSEYAQVIHEVLASELPKYNGSTVLNLEDLPGIYRECALILASAPRIFSAAVDGVLAYRFQQDSELQAEYAIVQDRAHIQPSIYVHILADIHGIAPTARQYLEIGEIARIYNSEGQASNELAWQIDNTTSPPVSASVNASGYKKYLATASSSRSSARLDTINLFCAGTRRRFRETPNSKINTPLPYPPSEVGYSINSSKRLSQHRHHRSSNYIMNLTEDICTYLHNTGHPLFTDQHFILHQFIIYLIFRPQQVRIAEIFTSGLLQVWIDNGGGFNHYPAGRSNSSGERVTVERWAEFEEWARRETELEANWRVQRQRIEFVIRVVSEDLGRIWREVMNHDS